MNIKLLLNSFSKTSISKSLNYTFFISSLFFVFEPTIVPFVLTAISFFLICINIKNTVHFILRYKLNIFNKLLFFLLSVLIGLFFVMPKLVMYYSFISSDITFKISPTFNRIKKIIGQQKTIAIHKDFIHRNSIFLIFMLMNSKYYFRFKTI